MDMNGTDTFYHKTSRSFLFRDVTLCFFVVTLGYIMYIYDVCNDDIDESLLFLYISM